MGLFGKKRENQSQQRSEKDQSAKKPEEKQQEMKVYIQGAGGTIVTKSILNGTTKLKWLFRQEGGLGNGWVAFGDKDSQEYVNDAKNMEIVDFNTLANIEPTVVNVFYMPMGSKYETVLDRRIPAGSYPVRLSVCLSPVVGLRIAAAEVLVSQKPAVRYEIAMPKGKKGEDLGKPGIFTFFGVDTGLACFADGKISEENRIFFEKWAEENPGKNKYMDYFASLFQESYETYPEFQNEGGSFLEWSMPGSGHRMVLFSSGMGDGVYSGYWGLDAAGKAVCLTVVFMNPEYF